MVTGSSAMAQTAIETFNKARTLYEAGNSKACIELLQTVEGQVGANPKIYSLYVRAYVEGKDYVKAAVALNRFKKLTGGRQSEAIKAVLDLEPVINNAVEQAESQHKTTLQQKRMEEANRIVAATAQANEQKKKQYQASFDTYKEAQVKTMPQEEIETTLESMGRTEQIAMSKELRKRKKIVEEYRIAFSDTLYERVQSINYQKRNEKGDIVERYQWEWLEEPPVFDEKMVDPAWTRQQIENKRYKTSTHYEYTPLAGNGSVRKVTEYTETRTTTGWKPRTDVRWQWFNDQQILIKDSLINDPVAADYYLGANIRLNKWVYNTAGRPLNHLDQSYAGKSLTYWAQKDYGNITPYSTTFKQKHYDGKGKTTYYDGAENYNAYGDYSETWDRIQGQQYANSIYRYLYTYDMYGNINAERCNSQLGGNAFHFAYFNFLQYADGYTPGLAEFRKMKQQIALIESRPLSPEALGELLKRGDAYHNNYRYREAIGCYKKYLRHDSANAVVYNSLAYSLYRQSGKIGPSVELLERALQADPQYAKAYDSMGELYLNTGNREKAIECYKKAAEMGYPNSMNWLKNNRIKFKIKKKS